MAAGFPQLLPIGGEADDQFGLDISMDGNLAVVGAPQDDDVGSNAGAAYIFEFNGIRWIQREKLYAGDPQANARFGAAVSFLDGRIVVGAPGMQPNDPTLEADGAAYVFQFAENDDQPPTEAWHQSRKLVATGGGPAGISMFGSSVAVGTQGIVVGAPGSPDDLTGEGKAYVYDPIDFSLDATLPDFGFPGDAFGQDVAIDGSTIVVALRGRCRCRPISAVGRCMSSMAARARGCWRQHFKAVNSSSVCLANRSISMARRSSSEHLKTVRVARVIPQSIQPVDRVIQRSTQHAVRLVTQRSIRHVTQVAPADPVILVVLAIPVWVNQPGWCTSMRIPGHLGIRRQRFQQATARSATGSVVASLWMVIRF